MTDTCGNCLTIADQELQAGAIFEINGYPITDRIAIARSMHTSGYCSPDGTNENDPFDAVEFADNSACNCRTVYACVGAGMCPCSCHPYCAVPTGRCACGRIVRTGQIDCGWADCPTVAGNAAFRLTLV